MPRATLRYLAAPDPDAAYVASVAGGPAAAHEGRFVDVSVDIEDARGQPLSLSREGFVLRQHRSAVTDFFDDAQLSRYAAELEALVRAETGAARVVVFDHTRRAASGALRQQLTAREPSATVHNDYTLRSGPQRLRDLLPEAAGQPFRILNVWRPVRGPVEDMAMAFCDAATVQPADLVPTRRVARDRIGEILFAVHRPAHRWRTFPAMVPDEVVLFETFNADAHASGHAVLHTAFADPGAPATAAARVSIESRCFVLG